MKKIEFKSAKKVTLNILVLSIYQPTSKSSNKDAKSMSQYMRLFWLIVTLKSS